ncbi:hypothetical protein K458DRAFT_449307 [Lentithecium fluviatile CBS 122367]|uniref:Uncharacterized protein n=1 Tax=Lentithecium fluviatile CBS 122367 TaxID=1168545 RepID=A0A6G1J5X9_9PLEO|nr:hypothetical protein K458DRAFT_449307 [Lentithecium fluviatile CBS 122367]
MPDKSIGWRKKIHSKPKDLKIDFKTDTKANTTTASRPETPVRVATPVPPIDVDDTKSEISESGTPRRPAKLARLVSGYRTLKGAPEEFDFAEPWSEDTPPIPTTPVDPVVALQSIYSHMNTLPTRPIPVDYYSGLYRIFEDYRKVRHEKQRLEELLHESFEGYRRIEEALVKMETQYQAEIRRLELLIVRDGTTGLAGLIRARQDSVIKRRRPHRKTVSKDRLQKTLEDIPMSKVDDQIKLKSQEVLLHRPSSPSGKMAALSRQFSFTGSADDLRVGTPPSQNPEVFLSRKARSEFDLTSLAVKGVSNLNPQSVDSGFSRTGDPLPDEIEPPSTRIDPGVECDAFIALQELGTLVARKKGINTSEFLDGLMQLLAMVGHVAEGTKGTEPRGDNEDDKIKPGEDHVKPDEMVTPKHLLRHFQSQPQLGSEQRRRRHFSFEPGDDEIRRLNGDIASYETTRRASSTDSDDSNSPQKRPEPTPLQLQLAADPPMPSKIPSPVQRPRLGSVRRDNSLTSQQHDDRRTSASSVLTAFRQNSNGSIRPISQTRNSSVAAIAAARAARSSGMMKSENSSPHESAKDLV